MTNINEPFSIYQRRVLWESEVGTLRAESFFDGTSRTIYLTRLQENGITLENPKHLAILTAEDLALIQYKIEQDARLSQRWKNQNPLGLNF